MIGETKALVGIEALRQYIQRHDGSPISRQLLHKLITKGLPASLIDGTWYAHKDNVDKWFQLITVPKGKRIIPEIDDDDE